MRMIIAKLNCNNKFAILSLSFFSFLAITNQLSIPVYNILSLVILILIVSFYTKIDLSRYNKIEKKYSFILSLIFTLIIVIGSVVYENRTDNTTAVFNGLFSLEAFVNLIGDFSLIFAFIIQILPFLAKANIANSGQHFKNPKIIFWICFVIIIIGWIPYFLTFFPGILNYDSIVQYTTIFYDFRIVSDHHPVLHTIFMAIPYNIGVAIFKTSNMGVACVSVVQMIIMSSIFAHLISFLYQRKINKWILLVILCYSTLSPIHGYYSITMWKDVLFGGFFLLFCIQIVKMVENKDNLCFKDYALFTIFSLLLLFFRNNAIYMYLLFIPLSVIFFKVKREQICSAIMVVITVFLIVKGPIFAINRVEPSSSAEYIGMPLQQIGRIVYKNIGLTTKEEKLISELMPVDKMRSAYNPDFSDSIKFRDDFNINVFNEHKLRYFGLWLDLVAKHPLVATESYLVSTLGYWYPNVEYWSVYKTVYKNKLGIYKDPKITGPVADYVKNIESRRIPILSLQWSIGLCFWIIALFAIVAYLRKGYKVLYLYTPIFGIWLTLMVASPVFAEFRYVYCAYTSLPLLILIPYLSLLDNNKIVKR